jgi:hypothetical protein
MAHMEARQRRLESIDVSDPRLYLAEQQLRILWEEILQRDLRFEITGPPQRFYSNFIRGIRSLPVRIVK